MDDYYNQVAGRVALALHLGDVREGFTSRGQRIRDHTILEKYGYDMALCECLPEPEKEVRLWVSRFDERRGALHADTARSD